MTSWVRLSAVALATTALAGCVVGPDYHKPLLPMPASWSSQKKAAPARPAQLSKWWQRLHDPELNTLVEEAVAGNLDVATAKARIREARASYRQSAATLFPSADGSGSATRNRTAATSSGGTAEDPYSQFQSCFDASWELDLFGANRRSIEAARYGLDASEEDLRSTLLTLIGDVASNYTEARAAIRRAFSSPAARPRRKSRPPRSPELWPKPARRRRPMSPRPWGRQAAPRPMCRRFKQTMPQRCIVFRC